MRLTSYTLCQIVLLIACFSLGHQVVLVEKTESQESELDQDVAYRLSSSDSNNYKVDEQSVIDYDKKYDIKAYDEIDNMYEYRPPKKNKQKVMHKHKKTGPRKQQRQGRKAHRPYDGNIVSNSTKKKMPRKKKHKFRKAIASRKPVDIIVHIKMKE